MATLTQQRADDAVTYGYLLVIESLPYAFTDLDGLIGNSSYLGATRTIKGGLIVPESLRVSADLRGGKLEDERAIFRVVDLDNTVAGMFAADRGAGSLLTLTQSIPADTDPAAANYAGPSGSVAVRSRYVGPEWIDASGNRRTRYIVPSAAGIPPGWDHLIVDPGEEPPVMVGEDPHVFAGLRVGLHRIVINRETGAIDSWADQTASGSLIWQGKLVDRAELSDLHTWSLECQGFDSWLAGDLNGQNPDRYFPIAPFVDLDDGETGIAVLFDRTVQESAAGFTSQDVTEYQGIAWDSSYDFASGVNDVQALALKLANAISDAYQGGSTYGNGPNYNTGVSAYSVVGACQMDVGTREIRLQVNSSTTDPYGSVTIGMHAKVAAALGWDFELQSDPTVDPTLPTQIYKGGPISQSAQLTGKEYLRTAGASALDLDGYVFCRLNTWNRQSDQDWDNSGAFKSHLPAYSSGSISLDPQGKQLISTGFGTVNLVGQKCLRPGATLASVPTTSGGTTMDSVGWLHVRGEVLRGSGSFDESAEVEEVNQVALVNWYDNGTGAGGTNGSEFYVIRWEDPRAFGFDDRKITKPLTVGGSTKLECAVLARIGGYVEAQSTVPDEFWRVIPRVLTASGTAGSWVGILPPGLGDNNPSEATGFDYWLGDQEAQHLGLNIEGEAIEALSWKEACLDVVGSLDAPLARCLYATVGPMQAADLLSHAHASRGLCMGISKDAGGRPKYSCFAPFLPITGGDVEYTLTDSDLAAKPGNAQGWFPEWRSRPFPPVDFFDFQTRGTPLDHRGQYETSRRSVDRGRISRTGQVRYKVEDSGLSDPSKFQAGDALWDWRAGAQAYWAGTVGRFLSSRTAMVTVTIKHTQGQYLYPGTAVRITNSFVQELDGTGLGLTAGLGRVVASDFILRGPLAGCTRATILVQEQKEGSGEGGRSWAGAARVVSVSNTGGANYDLTVQADHWGVGHGDSDARAFEEPGAGTYGGTVTLQILQSLDGSDWSYTGVATLTAVDTGTNTVSVTVTSGTLYADMFTLIALEDYDTQAASNWPRTLLSVVTNNEGTTFGGGPTTGWKLD